MFTRLSNSWALFQQCFAILRADKKLALFPLLAGAASLLVVISFAVPVGFYLSGMTDEQFEHVSTAQQILGYAVLFLFYLVNYFVVVFFNTALAACAIARFKGEDATLGDGLGIACARLPQILGWAMLSATVGTILRAIEERFGLVGRFVISLIGAAWAIATFLVVPTLAVEGVGPFEATKRSVALLRKCWGEGLAGSLGLNAISGVFFFALIAVTLLGVFLALSLNSIPALVVVLVVAVVTGLALAIFISTLGQIYVSGLYLFAAEGRIPMGFDESLLRDAFKPKK